MRVSPRPSTAPRFAGGVAPPEQRCTSRPWHHMTRNLGSSRFPAVGMDPLLLRRKGAPYAGSEIGLGA